MTTKDLNNLIRWCCDTDGTQFAKDIYHGDEMNDYKKGKEKLFGFFVGQVMKESKGKANPQLVNKVLKDLLSK